MSVPQVVLGMLAEVNPSFMQELSALSLDLSCPFLPMSAVSEEGEADAAEWRPLGSLRTGYTPFRRGDIIIAKITPCFENGKAARLREFPAEIGFGSTEFHVVRPGARIDASYLFHFLHGEDFRAEAAHYMTGTAGQRRLPADYLKRVLVPLPNMEEQKRISSICDYADSLARTQRKVADLARQLKRSALRSEA